MKKRKTGLLVEQLDHKLTSFLPLRDVPQPSEGWIHAVRTALDMSLRQLSSRLGISPQGVKLMEQREKEGAVTIKTLREVANVLNMKLVYGFVPLEGTIREMIDDQALRLARQIVGRTATSMKLEDQENTSARLAKAVDERAEELKRETPKLLWE